MAPTITPTVRVTHDPVAATHYYYLNGWYPLAKKTRGTWVYVEDAWPNGAALPAEGAYSVVIPAPSHVVYEGVPADTRLEQIVVEAGGHLEIAAVAGAMTSMVLSTLRVEEGGTLTIRTDDAPSSKVEIQFAGEIDKVNDPTELMNGLVSLGGTVSIEGRPRCSKMEEIVLARAGDTAIILAGIRAAECWEVGDEVMLPDTQVGLEIDYDFIPNGYDSASDTQMESAIIIELQIVGETTRVALDRALSFGHLSGAHVAMVSRSVILRTDPSSVVRGHILHTGYGAFDVKNSRVQDMGRSKVSFFNSTELDIDASVEFSEGLGKMTVTKWGDNQAARYALHAHHSLVPMEFSGNAVVGGLRFGIVAHNSRVAITDNVVVAVEGSGILLEDGTETGDVKNNFIIGAGGGSGESDSARFTPSLGTEFGHGGFAIWSRTVYSAIDENVAEGVFGESPYAFFLHLNFMGHRTVPPVAGTPEELIGRTRSEVRYDVNGGVLSLNTYGSFRGNSARGSYKCGFGANYFLLAPPDPQGHLIENLKIVSLGKSGAGFSFGHSSRFTLTGSLDAVAAGNTIVGVKVANGNLTVHDCDYTYHGIDIRRGGCMECFAPQEHCPSFFS